MRTYSQNIALKVSAAFGSPIPGRTYEADTLNGYRFGMNTQEKDDEIYGKGNASSAEFWEYDTRLGRRWNVDIILKLNESPYSTFSNNPIFFIDILGNTEFINSKGVWIGTDGDKTKDVTVVVTDYELAKEIEKQSIKGNDYTTPIPNDKYYELPSKIVLEAGVAVFDESLKPTIEDDEGGRHEVTMWFDKDLIPSEMVIGKDVLDAKSKSVKSAEVPAGVTGKVSIHSHPTSFLVDDKGKAHFVDASKPSNLPNMDQEIFKDFDVNIIVGKNGSPDLEEGSSRMQGDMIIKEPAKWVDNRTTVMNFFDKAAKLKATLSISSVRNVISGKSKTESKTFKKYEAAKAKAAKAKTANPAPIKK